MHAFVWHTDPPSTLRELLGVAVHTTRDGRLVTDQGITVPRRTIVALIDNHGPVADDRPVVAA